MCRAAEAGYEEKECAWACLAASPLHPSNRPPYAFAKPRLRQSPLAYPEHQSPEAAWKKSWVPALVAAAAVAAAVPVACSAQQKVVWAAPAARVGWVGCSPSGVA